MPAFALRALPTLAASLVALLLAGCETVPPPIDVRAIGQVQAEIKKQVGMYMLASLGAPITVKINEQDVDVRTLKDPFWCGSGNVDFDITTVEATLLTAVDTSVGFSSTLTVPIPIAPSGTFNFDRSTKNTQTLVYKLWPQDLALQRDEFLARATPGKEELKSAPIAQVLLNLRQALIAGATRVDYLTLVEREPQPCFSNYDPAKPDADSGQSFVVGLTITTTAKGSVSVGVSPAKVGASAGIGTTTGQTLKVTFVQRGLAFLQALKDRVDAACKPAKALDEKCKAMAGAYDRFRVSGRIAEEMRTSGLLPARFPDSDIPSGSTGLGSTGILMHLLTK